LDDYLQKLLKELGEAINRALEDSDDIAEARERIRDAGHEVYLVLEATVVLGDLQEDAPAVRNQVSVEQRLAEISHEDKQFLKGLNIKFDNDE
jgi:ArsR family metal-binding transcriptional regulator